MNASAARKLPFCQLTHSSTVQHTQSTHYVAQQQVSRTTLSSFAETHLYLLFDFYTLGIFQNVKNLSSEIPLVVVSGSC